MSARIIALVNHKGGVGKTTTTLNVGKALSILNQRVLLIDIDPQANLSQSVGIEDADKNVYHVLCEKAKLPIHQLDKGFDLIPAGLDLSGAELKLMTDINGYFKLREALEPVLENYDYVLIDCPPSLGVLTINALMAANEIVIVIQSQYLAIKGLQTISELVAELRKNLHTKLHISGMLLTQVNRTVVSKAIVDAIQKEHKEKVFQTVIRQNVKITEASTVSKDIFSYDETCAAAEDYMALAKELLS